MHLSKVSWVNFKVFTALILGAANFLVPHMARAQTAQSTPFKNIQTMEEIGRQLKQKPGDIALLVARAEVENYRCLYAQAVNDCKQAIAASGDHSYAYAVLAEAYLRLGFFLPAHDCLENALKLDPQGKYSIQFSEIRDLQFDAKNRVADPAKRWALACSSYLFTLNHEGCESLAGAELSLDLQRREEKLLAQWWEVHSREDLLKQIRSMVVGGHNQRWQKMRQPSSFTPGLQVLSGIMQGEDDKRSIELVKLYGNQFGERGLLSWDYCRIVCLCRWGYQVGYLTADEAWQIIMPVAARIQHSFTSWQQLKNEYEIGREFWCATYVRDDRPKVLAMTQRLFHDPKSPCLQNAWKTDLKTKFDLDTIYGAIDNVAHHRLLK